MHTLPRRFYARDSVTVARELLGRRLVRVLDDGTRLAGIIVEVEAYCGVPDAASHAFGGRRTPRNEAMYGPAGTAYVYFTYGMHHCVNVVCSRVGDPQAVLLRALEPVEGLEKLRELRAGAGPFRSRTGPERPRPRTAIADINLCSGPGKLCRALAIDRSLNEASLMGDSPLFIESSPGRRIVDEQILITPRIGIGYAGDWVARNLRWCIRGNPHVSGPRAGRT
jgi:DNA-3-methyladenine glycosylase